MKRDGQCYAVANVRMGIHEVVMMKKTLHISTAVALVALCMVAVLAFAGCTSTTVSKKSSEAALPANSG